MKTIALASLVLVGIMTACSSTPPPPDPAACKDDVTKAILDALAKSSSQAEWSANLDAFSSADSSSCDGLSEADRTTIFTDVMTTTSPLILAKALEWTS